MSLVTLKELLIGYAKNATGFSLFLAWMSCTFYSTIVWVGEPIGWLVEYPLVLSMLVSGLIGIALIGVLGKTRCARLRHYAWLPVVAAVLCVAGTLFLLGWVHISFGIVYSSVFGSLVASAGFSLFVLLWGSRMATFESSHLEFSIPFSFLVAYLIFFVLKLLEHDLACLLILILPCISAFMYVKASFKEEALSSDSVGANHASKKNGEKSASFFSEIGGRGCVAAVAILLIFRFWYGVIRSVSDDFLLHSSFHPVLFLILAIAIFSLFIYVALSFSRSINVSLAVSFILPLIVTTFALLHWDSPVASLCISVVSIAFSMLLRAFFCILFAKAAQRDWRKGVFYFSCYLVGLAFGNASGVAVGSWLLRSGSTDDVLLALSVILAILVALVMPLMRWTRDFASGNTLRAHSVAESTVQESGEEAVSSAMQIRAKAIAEKCGLSSREEEVLSYLLMGRNRPYIRDVLYISINTVNTHTRRIYEKTGVHSHQELINMAYGDIDVQTR